MSEPTRKELLESLIEYATVLEASNNSIPAKKYSDLYLYNKVEGMERALVDFILSAEEIDKADESFVNNVVAALRINTIRYPYLEKVLLSPNTRLLRRPSNPMVASFKVFVAKDKKSFSNNQVVYIDVTGIINRDEDKYYIGTRDVPILTSLLINAMTCMGYNAVPSEYVNNYDLRQNMMAAFSNLVNGIITYLRYGAVPKVREKVSYISNLYFLFNICQINPAVSNNMRMYDVAAKTAGLTNAELNAINYILSSSEGWYNNAAGFINVIATVIGASQLTIDVFVEKWALQYRSGTQYALEYYPALAAMMTNTFIGANIVNQTTINRNVGDNLVNVVSSKILSIGRDLVG